MMDRSDIHAENESTADTIEVLAQFLPETRMRTATPGELPMWWESRCGVLHLHGQPWKYAGQRIWIEETWDAEDWITGFLCSVCLPGQAFSQISDPDQKRARCSRQDPSEFRIVAALDAPHGGMFITSDLFPSKWFSWNLRASFTPPTSDLAKIPNPIR